MATDATGTPTPLGIPKFNTSADAPSGLGTNAMMDAIDALIQARIGIPAGIASGDVPVWNGTTFVKSSTLGMSPSGLSGYPSDISKSLRGDGSWTKSPALLYDSGDAGVTFPTASITTPALSQAYKHLRVIIKARDTSASHSFVMLLRLNGDGGANYRTWGVGATGSTVAAAGGGGATSASPFAYPGSLADANVFGAAVVDILDYTNATTWKSLSGQGGVYADVTAGDQFFATVTGAWQSTAAITTLTLTSGGITFAAGTRLSVYGLA